MSVTILLIPAALAAASLAGGAGLTAAARSRNDAADGTSVGSDATDASDANASTVMSVRTRMKDEGLLHAALEDLGAEDIGIADGSTVAGDVSAADGVSARIGDLRLTMSLTADEVWEAHVEREDGLDVDESAAADLIARLDAAYAARVQSAVADRIRARADSAGFELVSETRDDDATVTMVLTVREGA